MKKKAKPKKKNPRILPSLIVTKADGSQVSYLLDAKPMSREEYLVYQETLKGKMMIATAFRLVKR